MTGAFVALACVLACLGGASPALAGPIFDNPDAAVETHAKPADTEGRATGREVVPAHGRPDAASTPVVACSFEEPLCVHAGSHVAPSSILATIRDAEAALRGYRALGLPPPLPRLGGSTAIDVYLVPGAAPFVASDLAPTSDGWDSASAFAVLPPPSPRAGCEAASTVARAMAHAIGLRLDAGAENGALSMAASYLASLVAPCASVEIAAIDDFQRHPELSFIAGDPARPDGALLFPWFLDEAYGRGTPGLVMASLLALTTQRTPPGSLQWNNEPDIFDALRATMRNRGSTLDAMLLDFAVARAFVGSRSDGAHLIDVARFGDAGRVRFEWSVPYGSLPRRLAPGTPIEATGMTYLWVDTKGAPPGSELTFVADWEIPAVFRWALVKVDASGAETGRLDVAGIFGASHAEKTLVGLDGLAGVLIVGVHADRLDRSHPFDPDEQPAMPHGYTVTLAK